VNHLNGMGEALWWTANVLLSALAIAIAFYDGAFLAIATWAIGFLLLMVFRPK
jgi:hypothetical protein